MMRGRNYDWKRFWCPWDGIMNLTDGGYLANPDGPYGDYLNPNLRSFQRIAEVPCLALLGEPGIGKTETMRAERATIDADVRSKGDQTLWLDLRSCGSEQRLEAKLFASPEFASWREGGYRLHVFLDSLDECLLRVDTVAALLVDELQNCPVDRLSLRVGCRTAEWPNLLKEGLKELWPEGGFEAYELAPLRRVDVISAARANDIDPEALLRSVDEAEAVPLAIKPVTLGFLMGSYRGTGEFPIKQADLYLEGCRWLCEERNISRVSSRHTGELTPAQRVAVAARIAAVTVFSNKYAVWSGVQQAVLEEEDVLVRTLAGGTEHVGEGEFAVGEDAVREVLGTGLFSARGPERLGWAHQTYAEFLAARYLIQRGVGTEQAMSLLVHPDDEGGRLVPQLHEAAAWLASMSPDVFREITETDPEVLLRSDVASTDVEDKAALVATMMRLYDEGKLLDVGLVPRNEYRKLTHPGLAEQLETYIADADKGFVVRRVALDVAEACGLRSLQEVAVEVALDASQPTLVRTEAARFVAHVGDGPTRGRLKPMALGGAEDDSHGDLKGWGLRAVWPDHMSAKELFGTLVRPNESYLGAYASFLSREIAESLRPADLPVALAWVEGQQRRYDMSYRFAELMDQIMLQAWKQLDVPPVRQAFAKAALARLRQHDEIVQERSSTLARHEGPSFRERVAADDQKRRGLMEEMLELLQGEDEDIWLLAHYKTPLLLGKDAAWLVDKLESATSDRRRAVIAALLRRAFHGWEDEQHEIVYLAYERTPTLADEVGRFFDPIDLSSEEARQQRRYNEEATGRREQREQRPSPNPPIAERVMSALDDFEAGDVESFWRLVYWMKWDGNGFAGASEAEWDLTAFPGWRIANGTARLRIVEAAKRYVMEGDPKTDEWLGKNVIYYPAFAGYRALRLLMNFAPDFVSEMQGGAWERWAPIILDFPVSTGTGEEKPHLELVAMAYRHAPDAFVDTLMFLLDKEDEEKGYLFVLRDLEECWDDRLARILLNWTKDRPLKPQSLTLVLETLLDYGLDEAREYAETLVDSRRDDDDEKESRAVVAAQALVLHAGEAGWSRVWPAMQEDDGFGGAVVDAVAAERHHADLPQKYLSESQVADLYIWLARRYPRTEYFVAGRSNGMVAYGRKEHISNWRDGIMRHLQNRGTFEACRQIERIAEELPELRETLKWTLYQAKTEARRQTWVPPEPEDVLVLAARLGTRLVQNGDQLLAVLIESLGRLEEKLQGETPLAPALWNHANGSYRPKDEDWFSDVVKQHLQEDLRGRGVVLNREVVIRKGEGEGRGERTDLHVDAFVPGSDSEIPDLMTVIVEAKGCWNEELNSAMEEQLAGRYLGENPACRHGLYLVGWFNCPQWDKADWRWKRAPRYGLGEARERFAEQARALSERGVNVQAVVVNAALR